MVPAGDWFPPTVKLLIALSIVYMAIENIVHAWFHHGSGRPAVTSSNTKRVASTSASSAALITGITGQDGSYLAELLLDQGYEVVGVTRRTSAPNFWRVAHILDRIDIRGIGGQSLKAKWRSALETFLGVQVTGFPNLFMVMGPHTALGNIPRSIEYNVEWVTDLIGYMRAHGLTRADARPEAVALWTENVRAAGEGLLTNEIDSWMTGVNSNVDGKQVRTLARYSGSAPAYRAWCDAVAGGGYREIDLC